MTINKAKFERVVEEAKAKAANDPKWLRAIEKASTGLLDGSICVTLFADGYALVTTATGQHRVNGRCACRNFTGSLPESTFPNRRRRWSPTNAADLEYCGLKTCERFGDLEKLAPWSRT
jgi:hypothetical protein